MKTRALVAFLDDYLNSPGQADFGPNGLQVQGRDQIHKIVTSVSSCQELFDRAAEAGADAVLVHHGIFWKGLPLVLTGMQYRRVKTLLEHEINLIAYHLPLDRHAEVGNNALAAAAFGLQDIQSFAPYEGEDIGFWGRFPEPVSPDQLSRRCTEIYGQEPLLQGAGPDDISTLGIVSGGAQSEMYAALGLGLDAYITGESSEWVMNVARENGIHYLAAGHYATERLGIRRLGELVTEKFGLEVEFIDVPNPV
ncbi:MAG: Nif3-like dinuclear metal center hexameric protein [Thermoanaerobaculia bacterium]|nr:Nif3-like dinuclear metal center hexameric protein [Thermoanaerobaculia bacterium]